MPPLQPPPPFAHWMLAEIYEQPQSLQATLEHYAAGESFREDAAGPVQAWLARETELLITASGSSRHAGMVGMAVIEAESTLRVAVEFASEYGARVVQEPSRAGVVVISQSGETADTLAALRLAAQRGLPTLAISNVTASTMAQEAEISVPVIAGRERAIPATKSFTAQLLVLRLLSLLAAASTNTMTADEIGQQIRQLHALPGLIGGQMERWHQQAGAAAGRFKDASSFLFLGRGVHYPIALEGALKLKESAYIHAEGYPAGELKHGPNALVGQNAPLVFIATVDRDDENSLHLYGKTLSLMRDMRSQGAGIIAVGNSGDRDVEAFADAFLGVDAVPEPLQPICEVIPLQLLAYCFAVSRGVDVDRPRNLVKAVVVE